AAARSLRGRRPACGSCRSCGKPETDPVSHKDLGRRQTAPAPTATTGPFSGESLAKADRSHVKHERTDHLSTTDRLSGEVSRPGSRARCGSDETDGTRIASEGNRPRHGAGRADKGVSLKPSYELLLYVSACADYDILFWQGCRGFDRHTVYQLVKQIRRLYRTPLSSDVAPGLHGSAAFGR